MKTEDEVRLSLKELKQKYKQERKALLNQLDEIYKQSPRVGYKSSAITPKDIRKFEASRRRTDEALKRSEELLLEWKKKRDIEKQPQMKNKRFYPSFVWRPVLMVIFGLVFLFFFILVSALLEIFS